MNALAFIILSLTAIATAAPGGWRCGRSPGRRRGFASPCWGKLSQSCLQLWLPVKVINGQVQKQRQVGKLVPGSRFKPLPFSVQCFQVEKQLVVFCMLMILPWRRAAVSGKYLMLHSVKYSGETRISCLNWGIILRGILPRIIKLQSFKITHCRNRYKS